MVIWLVLGATFIIWVTYVLAVIVTTVYMDYTYNAATAPPALIDVSKNSLWIGFSAGLIAGTVVHYFFEWST